MEKKGFFSRLKEGLTKTRDNIVKSIDTLFYDASCIDEEFFEELEETLVMGDIGINATQEIIEKLRVEIKANLLTRPADCKELLIKTNVFISSLSTI